jgi:large subunit ribosomal protein L6
MSRVGNKPIPVPEGVTVTVKGATVSAQGPQGNLSWDIPEPLAARLEKGELSVTRRGDDKRARALHGTARSLIASMVEGVHKGFTRELEIQGVGYRAQVQGTKFVAQLGYSHEVVFEAPEGVQVAVSKDGTGVTVSGPSKQLVGQVAAQIRSFFPAEPYKGKGVRYKGEYVRRKAGKTVA